MINEEPSTNFDMAVTEQENIAKSVEYEILKVEKLRALIFAIVIGLLTITYFIVSNIYLSNAKYGDKMPIRRHTIESVSYTHLRAHET
jgi:hypothetical protein